jgi:pimeloyl-ACP methyl ester carboxylesterase
MFSEVRTVDVEPPARTGTADGLAFALFLPRSAPAGGVVLVHGADSRKENHFDVARALRSAGLAVVAYDQRGHGDSEGALGAGVLDDVGAMAALLPPAPLALRGSSLGGFVVLAAGARLGAAAVVAICPPSAEQLARGLRTPGRFGFRADRPALGALLEQVDLEADAAVLGERLLLLHAEADETVPVEHSRALHAAAPGSRLVAVPGGHHRSVQHDPELQALSVRFIASRCGGGSRRRVG